MNGVQVDAPTADTKLRESLEEQLPTMLQQKFNEVRAQLVTPKRNECERINVACM